MADGSWSSAFIRRIIYNIKMCVRLITQLLRLVGWLGSRKPVQPHRLDGCRGQTDRPKSARNRCVIEVLVAFLVVTLLLRYICGCRGFCHGTESVPFLFM